MKVDLHIHTTASDGRLSPQEVVDHAISMGLTHIAITDHDTVNAIIALHKLDYLKNKNITMIPGIEFSTDLPSHEVHVLGYFIDIFNTELQSQLDIIVADRWDRVKRTIIKLANLGYSVDYKRVVELAGGTTSVGRPHIARVLVEKGYFSSVTDVFNTLLYKNGPAYVPHYKLDYHTVIKLIQQAGGISVLAHPGLISNDLIVHEIIDAGIQGIEVYHPCHNADQTIQYLKMAEHYNKFITGGSDFHGIPTRFPDKLGVFTIPPSIIDAFLNRFGHE
ncbi:PHP domain-containing protein [bacterium BFN5]|nr:PHP domain-containing protein [bacterium BFN5]